METPCTVTFADAKLDLYEDRVMNYYAGMKNVAQKDLYDTLAKEFEE